MKITSSDKQENLLSFSAEKSSKSAKPTNDLG
jgi:hypothetical protein